MTSHSKILFPTRPQLMPGMSLSLCMSLSWRLKSPEAAELAMMGVLYGWRMEGVTMGNSALRYWEVEKDKASTDLVGPIRGYVGGAKKMHVLESICFRYASSNDCRCLFECFSTTYC